MERLGFLRDGTAVELYWAGGAREYIFNTPITGVFAYTKIDKDTATLAIPGVFGGPRKLTFGSARGGGWVSDSGQEGTFVVSPIVEAAPLLANVANRSFVAVGRPATAGFILQEFTEVLVRGVGPGLAVFGVASPAARPKLKIFAGSAAIPTNSGFPVLALVAESLARITAFCGAFPLTDARDSAVVLRLGPGAYTVQAAVESDAEAGEVLIEVYAIPGSLL